MRLTSRYIAFLLVLVLLLHEAHELAHLFTGNWLCGCAGSRDFLYWQLCNTCLNKNIFIVTAFAGPFITYIFIWTGYFLLHKKTARQRNLGFTLIIVSLPAARIFAAASKGGDEIMALREWINNYHLFTGAPVIIGGLLVLILTLPPLWKAYKSMEQKNRLALFAAFLLLPYFFDKLVLEITMNHLLKGKWFNTPGLSGMPVLIITWDIVLLLLMVLTKPK